MCVCERDAHARFTFIFYSIWMQPMDFPVPSDRPGWHSTEFSPSKECSRRPLGRASDANSGSVALSFHQTASTMRLTDGFFPATGRKTQIVVEPVRINTKTWMNSWSRCACTISRDSCFAHSNNSQPALLLIISLLFIYFLFLHILVPIRSSLPPSCSDFPLISRLVKIFFF